MKPLNKDFIDKTLKKIETVMNCVLQYHKIEMKYDLNKRNELFCEVIKKNKQDLITTEIYKNIQETLHVQNDLNEEQSEWLSGQIYQFNKDIFLLHYFYAIIYTYNYNARMQQLVMEEHIQCFFEKANDIYKKYKNLTLSK